MAILSRTKHRHLNVVLNRSLNTPIGQNEYVWRVGTRGRFRIRFLVRVRKNVPRCIAASGKKSGIGAVLSEQSSFAEVGINRRRALRILSRIRYITFYMTTKLNDSTIERARLDFAGAFERRLSGVSSYGVPARALRSIGIPPGIRAYGTRRPLFPEDCLQLYGTQRSSRNAEIGRASCRERV